MPRWAVRATVEVTVEAGGEESAKDMVYAALAGVVDPLACIPDAWAVSVRGGQVDSEAESERYEEREQYHP